MADVFGGHLRDFEFDVTVDEIDAGGERRLADAVRLTAGKTPHTDESLAYRLEAGGRSFCFTGDTGPGEDVGRFAQGVDVLLAECSVPEEDAMPTHLTPGQVAELARVALPGRLLLTHVYPQLDRSRLPQLVRDAGWPAAVHVVADGDRIEV
jgi:ribonuclease BN (tRNA processing enzyme)